MAYHRKHHRKHHRRNPLGLSGGVVKEAAFVAAGAVGAAALPGMVAPSLTGWAGVAASAGAAIALGFVGKMVGDTGGDMLKGGLAISVLKALKQAGINTPGLGLYAPSWFGVPTASSQYLQAAAGNQPGFNRGGGTIIFPGPAGPVAIPAAAGVKSHLGYHRFRSRYAGGYG
jgi:hypothetical protein